MLRYIHERYIGSKYAKAKGSERVLADNNHKEIYLCEITSANLSNCIQRFADLEGDKNKVEQDLKRYDTATWMSGLACCSSDDCCREYSYIMPDEVVAGTAKINVFKSSEDDCPPGCNCDNPWPFLA